MEGSGAHMMQRLVKLRDFGANYIDYRTAWMAALILSFVVWMINLSHGALPALPAALKQATYTFFVAGFIVRLCENLATKVTVRSLALALAVVIPSSIAIGLTFALHSLKGTPEPLHSTIPTMLMAPPSFFVWGWRSRTDGNEEPKHGRSRLRRTLAWGAIAIALAGLSAAVAVWLAVGTCREQQPTRAGSLEPIAQCLLLPHEGLSLWWSTRIKGEGASQPQYGDFTRFHPSTYATAIDHVAIPDHPFMAVGGNNMHNDAYVSDAYAASGPLGLDPQVVTRTQGFGGYGTIAFDRWGRIVGVYSNGRGFQIELMDPDTLQELASYDLPSRPWYFPLQGVLPWKYIGAGMYFYLDERDRAVVPTTRNTIEVVQAPAPGSSRGFEWVRTYDLSQHVVPMHWPRQDSVAWVLPDWGGERYWFATLEGMVGSVEVESGEIQTHRLAGESIENSFAVGEEGIFIISDRALYRFNRAEDGSIVAAWRAPYDRGPGIKPGHITRGSGSSVTLAGGLDGLVVITDNAEPRIHVQSFRRSDGEKVCSVPVFPEGKSGTDLSVSAFEHADEAGRGQGSYSILVENNWGPHSFPRPHAVPGLTRVDAKRREDGGFLCREVWASDEKSIGVVKLSLGNGLAYMYLADDSETATGWYFTAIDFRSGETVYRKHTGLGHGFNNWQGALFLHPDSGAAYTTTIFGLVMMRDGAFETGSSSPAPLASGKR